MQFRARQIQPGDLDTRIVIERDATVRSSTGSKAPWTTPATVATVYAACDSERSGREATGRDVPVSVQDYLFYVRTRRDVHPKMRVKLTQGSVTRYFEISAIRSNGMREPYMALVTQEVI